MSYSISIIGTGYVGLVTGTSFAATGNKVLCIDNNEKKIMMLDEGKTPIYEPGLDYIMNRNIKDGRLRFSTNLAAAVEHASIIFLCLPTPPNEDGSADLHHVLDVAKDIANIIKEKDINERKIIVNKSTVPVGTVEKVTKIFSDIIPDKDIFVVSNPEFLREGFAVEDSMKPERVVIGTSSQYAKDVMQNLYKPFVRSGNPILIMDEKSAEVTKYAANSFLAMKISYMNDLSAYCEKVGADIEKIRMGIGSDSRIGKRFLFAGLGYGGSCFPKDVRALIHSSEEVGVTLSLVKAAWEVNLQQQERFLKKIYSRYNGNIEGKTFAIWGLAFKPNTDDIREAPAFRVIDFFLENGAYAKVYDPEAIENTKVRFCNRIIYADDPLDCLSGTDALIIVTEWNVFRNPDLQKIRELLAEPIIFDGRNLFNPDLMEQLGFEYYSIGRKDIGSV